MAAPKEFTLDAVRLFIIDRGGKVTNHELVKHFKQFLTDPLTKESARVQFKEYVNLLATIKQQDDEKYLVLKSKFFSPLDAAAGNWTPTSPPESPLTRDNWTPFGSGTSLGRAPPPYRPPPEPYRRSPSVESTPASPLPPAPPVVSNPAPLAPLPAHILRQNSTPPNERAAAVVSRNFADYPVYRTRSLSNGFENGAADVAAAAAVDEAPAVPARRKPNGPPPPPPPSSNFNGQGRHGDKENVCVSMVNLACDSVRDDQEELKISVKERTQRFNKMASEVDLQRGNNSSAGRRESKTGDDDDTSSVGTMEPRAKEWMLVTARGDYHEIARLLREEPRLAKRRDFVTGYTALHWAAKHGNDGLVKMLAGTYKSDVNARTNAGCTPLHIAAQHGHEEVHELLAKTYGADANLRDYSGKKPYQYFPRQDTSVSTDIFRKITAKRNLAAEKEAAAGFLRIGSLNVRVKKTTEAFNNLLSSASSSSSSKTDKLHKLWGSSDNLNTNAEGQLMPPPKQVPPKKKRPKDWPQQQQCAEVFLTQAGDGSDSDSACGFGTEWKSP